MDKKDLEEFQDGIKTVVDESIETHVKEALGAEKTEMVKDIVKKLRYERALLGSDVTGLDDETKTTFAKDIKNIARGEKTALLSNNDSTGGYLVPEEVHAGIIRIAESVGLVARDARRFAMSTDTLDIPRYTGSELLGNYIGEDEEGTETGVSFGDARLITKTWQVIFRVGNTLLADANVDVADWLLALSAEGMSARLDKEGFVGGTFTGSGFVGLLGSDDVTTYTLATGNTDFEDFGVDDASDVIGQVKTGALPNSAFYFHRTVWAKIRQAKDGSGNYLFNQSPAGLAMYKKENGIQPVGEILGYPVYTTDYLPDNTETAVSTKFGIFGNLELGLMYGDRGPVEFAKSDSATVNSKNVFTANQTAIRVQHRHSLAVGVGSAVVAIKTASS